MIRYPIMLAAALLASPSLAAPGFIALEGSDATSFHGDPQYSAQLFTYLKGGSSKQVLIYNRSGTFNIDSQTGQMSAYTTTLVGVTLSDYSALYIQTPGTCCTADNTVLNGFGTAVSTFIAAGGNFSIGDWVGGDYDGVVPGGNAPFGAIQGAGVNNGGVGFGSSCTDNEVITAAGIAKGFTQPPRLSCWAHQGYSNAYFSTFGYVNLISSAPGEYRYQDGTDNGSSFLAVGGTLGTVPEPGTWALLIVGFGMVGTALRRRTTTVLA